MTEMRRRRKKKRMKMKTMRMLKKTIESVMKSGREKLLFATRHLWRVGTSCTKFMSESFTVL